MNDQPIPEAINGIIDNDEKKSFWSHFKRDFDVTSNVIIYHPHQQSNHDVPPLTVAANSKQESYGAD
ncbi:ATP-dependent helicase/deoxyribonuclease subunit B [Bienertia sinuspersici]